MYLTGGQYKGTKIEVPKSAKPTLSKVRESIFNILFQFDFDKKTFLDMFSGSAIMGLEAISRGYKVKEVEINSKSAAIIKKNYEKLKIKPDIIIKNALLLNEEEKFEIIYLDPPWDMDYEKIIIKANNLLDINGVIIVEHDSLKNIQIKEIIEKNKLNLEIFKEKKYGRCLITILKKM